MHLTKSTAEHRAIAKRVAIAPSKDTVLHKNLKRKKLGPAPIAVGANVHRLAIIHPSARIKVVVIKRNAVVGEDVALADQVVVCRGARLEDETRVMFGSVVGPQAIVKKRAWVGNDVVIGKGAIIGEDARIGSDCEIIPGGEVEPGTHIHKHRPHPAKA